MISSVNLLNQGKIIDLSWKRCHTFGLSPTGPVNDILFTGKKLQKVLKKNEYLIKHTTAILEKLYPTIHSSGLVTVIVDRNGTIIHKIGKLDIDESFDHFPIGSNWSEEIKGTNAIGLAIYEKKSIITHAEHHFYVKNHFLTCAASPIFSPSGDFIGAVNISARKELFHPSMVSLASMIVEAVQNRLLMDRVKQEKLLALKEMEYAANICLTPHLTLDHERRIIRANQPARQLLGSDCIGQEFHMKDGYSVDITDDQSNKVFRSVVSLHRNSKKTLSDQNLYTITDIIGSCEKIVSVRKMVKKAALSDYPIIIYGESGTGKELIAQSLHSTGPRKIKPFIAVNCSAIPESLIESELFGYERGAFTGAKREGATGKFEAADGGTIFLDEIGDMPLKAQAALLRVLQEKSVTRIGGDTVRVIDTRVIAATNKNLREEVQAGRFRGDLYYRLRGIFITLPPLRNRTDIIELAEHLITELDSPFIRLSNDAKQKLISYHWPGNIRELKSVLMQASFFAEDHEINGKDLHFEDEFERQPSLGDSEVNTSLSLMDTEKSAILKALHSVEWNITRAANILQISRNTLYMKIRKYNLRQ
ncbi:sigma-54-dependent Fis family transcriptional regulator [Cytobacillus depressus]|uniref:Sigma-54-dependent Fis family transcriptional regulator n=1 Tax=Cytobacillus depressus TaxID=1602942 RepID=A0A6L3V510_9BACI|nr:sigma-54-dependent Fis family transcriptional regulator [Cytobacillus depressus]KAB2333323.1 sigma-54-dependent Fis family transcriptional regulator [Cytobacillus depressus]